MTLDLRHIRYFVALAEELNFSRAAERLHIAQPPLSRQIKELEERVGALLFHRTKRQVALTDAGKVFLSKAYQILDQVEDAYLLTRLASTGMKGEIRIGFTSTVHDMIPILKAYRERFPQVGISLKHLTSTQQIEALLENRLDIGVIGAPVNNRNIEVLPYLKAPFLAVLPENHTLANKDPLYLRDLADETFIMTPSSTGALYYDTVMSIFQHARIAPNLTIQADEMQTVLALVADGMGITLSPSPIEPYKGVIKRKLEDVDLTLQASLAWKKDNRSHVLANLLAFLREQSPPHGMQE